MPKKEIKITCKGHTTMPIEALENFQGNLKTLEKDGWNVSGIRISKLGKLYRGKSRVVPIICGHCGVNGWATHSNFVKSENHFCSPSCYHSSDLKQLICLSAGKDPGRISRLSERNKTKDMIEKSRKGRKQRIVDLGRDHLSEESRRKIGLATKARWEDKKFSILPVLVENAKNMSDKTKYGHTFRKIKSELIERFGGCFICGENNHVAAHHILPVRAGGESHYLNMVPLCRRCHKKIETFQWRFYRSLRDSNFYENEAWQLVYACFNHTFRVLMTHKFGSQIHQ